MRLSGSSRPSATALAVLISATLAVMAPAAEPPAVPPTFTAEAELVTVDVLVVDGHGKPISDLKREDFRVLEDGEPQVLTAFEAVEAKLPPLEPRERVAPPPSASRFETNVSGPSTRRTFGIVFDDLHIGSINAGQARKALTTFLSREARAGDRLVLVTTSDGRFWTTTHGANSRQFGEAFEHVVSNRRGALPPDRQMSPVEAMRIAALGEYTVAERVRRRRAILSGTCVWTVGRCECQSRDPSAGRRGRSSLLAGDDGCQEPAGAESAEEAYGMAAASAGRTLRVVREAIAALGAQRDRKVLVLVSEGFLMDPSIGGFRDVRDAAARSNVVLYFLDARGLAVAPEFLSASGPSAALPVQDITAMMEDWRREADGPRVLAEETGGLSLQSNDLVGALQRIADESRVAYLLGYEPASPLRDGRYHKLKVEVLRPGLQVRARAGYFAPKGERADPRDDRDSIARALRDPFDRDGIALRLTAYVLGPAQQTKRPRFEVLVVGEMRRDALAAGVVAGRRIAAPKLTLLTESPDREWHKSEWSEEVTLTPDQAATEASGATATSPGEAETRRADEWHPFLTRVAMQPGEHRLRLVVQSGDRMSSVTVDLVVPKAGGERLSTPILSDRLVAEAEGRRVMPLARRTFDASGTLHCWVELYEAAVDRSTHRPRVSARFVARSVDGREWAAGELPALGAEGDGTVRLVGIPLAEAPAGENELQLTVRDEVSGHTFEAREPFRVEGGAGEHRTAR
jgi:VWFA-related protein